MELKLSLSATVRHKGKLLIVPYGIETRKPYTNGRTKRLLIVPYGIETHLVHCYAA